MKNIIKMAFAAIFLLVSISQDAFAQNAPPTWQTQVLQAQARGHQRALEDLYARSRGSSSTARETRTRLTAICTVPAEGSGGEAVAPSDSNPCPALSELRQRLDSGEFVATSDFAPFSQMIQAVCSVTDPTEEEATATCPRLDRIEERLDMLEAYNTEVLAPTVEQVADHEERLLALEKDPTVQFGLTFAEVGVGDDIDTGAIIAGGFGFRYQLSDASYGVTRVRLGVSTEGWDFNPGITTTFLRQFGSFSIGGGLVGSLDAGALNEGGVQAFGITPVVEMRGSFGSVDLHLTGGPGLSLTRDGAEFGGELTAGATVWFP